MNPHASHPLSVKSLLLSLWRHKQLIKQMIIREVVGRYRGSVMGLMWSFLNPVLMLVVYTWVFSGIFNARWGVNADENKAQFALVLFVGLISYGVFAEIVNRAPSLILSNANYVKKVVFPLEILPVITMGAAFFHTLASLCVLVIALYFFNNAIPVTALFTPLVLFPLLVLSVGIAWFLASLGVYLRDIGQSIGIITSVLMFLSPVFYPLSSLSEEYQSLMMMNPLTFIIEQAREILIWGHQPDWQGLGLYTLVSLVVSWAGYVWFQKTRKGFADVL